MLPTCIKSRLPFPLFVPPYGGPRIACTFAIHPLDQYVDATHHTQSIRCTNRHPLNIIPKFLSTLFQILMNRARPPPSLHTILYVLFYIVCIPNIPLRRKIAHRSRRPESRPGKARAGSRVRSWAIFSAPLGSPFAARYARIRGGPGKCSQGSPLLSLR